MKFALEGGFSEELINDTARSTGFVRRARKLPASCFVNVLMFPFCSQANTSLPDIAADLNQQFGIDISKEGLHKKFTHQGVEFLKELIKMQLSKQFSLSTDDELKKHFRCIKIKDSTKFSLPDIYSGAYPGFGNFSKKNGVMNLQYEYDLAGGNWTGLDLTSVKRNDQLESKETAGDISEGDLYIRDLGYVTPAYLKAVINKKASFLNRLPPQISVYDLRKEHIDWENIDRRFNKTGASTLDLDVLIYQKELLGCRLIVERLDDDEYKKRLKNVENGAKSRGVGLSKKRRLKCRYNTFITNIDRKTLSVEKIRKTYYLRWQIELVFKTWKSFFEINKVKKVKKERMECQLLARLLWILLNWHLFQACNQYVQTRTPGSGLSVLMFFKRCLGFSPTLRLVVLRKMELSKWLKNIFLPLINNTACEAPWGKQTHYQVLNSFITVLS